MAGPAGADHASLAYPPAPRVEQVDVYHGTRSPIPTAGWRTWTPRADQAWVEAQNR